MNTQRLIEWIDTHDMPHPTLNNRDGTLTAFFVEVPIGGKARIACEVIPATLKAARDLLGY